jgi:hypothetical protein
MVIVSHGVTHTTMRANLDGSRVEMLVETYWRTALRSSPAAVGAKESVLQSARTTDPW